jgi:hypothetical protein
MTLPVYASLSDLAKVVTGGTAAGTAVADRLASAVYAGSRYVDGRLGNDVGDYVTAEYPLTADSVEMVPCDPRWRSATIVAATRFYKSADIPFGVVGGWEYAVRAQGSIPEVDLILGISSVQVG